VERRAQRMKAQIDDAQGKLTAAEEESGRLRNELYTTTMQLEEHKKTVEMQAVELDTLGKLSYTQRVQLDDVLAKKADLEHHHSLLSMELEELQKVHANYKSQMEQKCDIYEVEAAHKAQMYVCSQCAETLNV
jgi:chromosome segregation ATPase